MTYRILLVVPQDYLRHPHPTRLHHIFENFKDDFKVTVLNVRLRRTEPVRKSRLEVVEIGVAMGNMLHSYMRAYVDFHLKLADLMKRERYDCVVLSHILSPIVPLLVRGRPLVFDYKDVYSQLASAPFKAPVRQFVYFVGKIFELTLFRYSTTIVVPTMSMQTMLHNRHHVGAVLITNGVDTEVFHPLSSEERLFVRSRLGVGERDFCVCYLGSVEPWLDLETVVCALERLSQAKLLLIGGPVRSSDYMDRVLCLSEQKGIRDRVVAKGFVSQQEAAKIVAASDLAIIPFRTDTEMSLVALPDKLFEYLATRIPVISTRLPDVVKLFGDSVHFYGDVDELVGTIGELMTRATKGHIHRGRGILVKGYDWKLIARKYQDLLVNVIRNSRGSQSRATALRSRV